jgi:hypothetical protein
MEPRLRLSWTLLLLLFARGVDGAGFTALWAREACMDVEIVRLLHSSLVSAVTRECEPAIEAWRNEDAAAERCTPPVLGGDEQCPAACRRAVEALSASRCFADISRTQRDRPRSSISRLQALQGTWLGLYPNGGLELVRVRADKDPTARKPSAPRDLAPRDDTRLVGTKLTGNDFMKAGRTTWEASDASCRVQSSEFAGAFVPRWDSCALASEDADHFTVKLFAGQGRVAETIHYVRAERRLILDWALQAAPVHGVGAALRACGLDASDAELWLDLLDVGGRAIAVDQLLLVGPFAILLAWHASAAAGWSERRRWLLLQLSVPGYILLLYRRLHATGAWDEMRWAYRALLGGPTVWLNR